MTGQLAVQPFAFPQVAAQMLRPFRDDRPARTGRNGDRGFMPDRRRERIGVETFREQGAEADATLMRVRPHHQQDAGHPRPPTMPWSSIGMALTVLALLLAGLVASIREVGRVIGPEHNAAIPFLFWVGCCVLAVGLAVDLLDLLGIGGPPRLAPLGVVDATISPSLSLPLGVPQQISLAMPLSVSPPAFEGCKASAFDLFGRELWHPPIIPSRGAPCSLSEPPLSTVDPALRLAYSFATGAAARGAAILEEWA